MENSDRTPKNLTGYSGRMQVRSTVASSTVLMEATTANGRITITPLTGLVSVRVAADITTAMTWTSGVYDLEVYTC